MCRVGRKVDGISAGPAPSSGETTTFRSGRGGVVSAFDSGVRRGRGDGACPSRFVWRPTGLENAKRPVNCRRSSLNRKLHAQRYKIFVSKPSSAIQDAFMRRWKMAIYRLNPERSRECNGLATIFLVEKTLWFFTNETSFRWRIFPGWYSTWRILKTFSRPKTPKNVNNFDLTAISNIFIDYKRLSKRIIFVFKTYFLNRY